MCTEENIPHFISSTVPLSNLALDYRSAGSADLVGTIANCPFGRTSMAKLRLYSSMDGLSVEGNGPSILPSAWPSPSAPSMANSEILFIGETKTLFIVARTFHTR